MAHDESEGTPVGGVFTNKEMWVRVDAKLDTLVARQQHFDVELALLKERQHQQEVALRDHDATERADRARLAQEMTKSEELMAREVQNLKDGQLKVGALVKWTAAVVGALVVLTDGLIRFFS